MNYEYCIKFFNKKTGKYTGGDIDHLKTYEQAVYSLNGCSPHKGEKAVIMKREVGEWIEVK